MWLICFMLALCSTNLFFVNSYNLNRNFQPSSLFQYSNPKNRINDINNFHSKTASSFTVTQSSYCRTSSICRRYMSMTTSISPPTRIPTNLNIPLPQHERLVQGKLDNGFTYIIYPNAVPPGRFEAHLEILSGSAHELEDQQGMAHLLEHVAYMGSPKRQLISGTGSRTNAYTDFHHTVFYASCPTMTPDQFWKKPMLPMALDALLDVMTTKVDDDRLEKERAAVLSEASMVNKMEYRVECQVLSALHSENRISLRFPIGKENLIKQWTREDVQRYHNLHYRPDNAILFLVGDVEIDTAIETIKLKFGNLAPKVDTQKVLQESGEYPNVSMRAVSRHFPPVVHRWSCTSDEAAPFIPRELITPSLPVQTVASFPVIPHQQTDQSSPTKQTMAAIPSPKIFSHELLQAFSFHLFAKRPIEPITTFESLKREIMRRMTLSALQIRFNVQQRQDPLFTFVDFNQLNWPREGCAVCSLDLTTDTASWKDAVMRAILEIRRLGYFGLSEGELVRYKQAILAEASQAMAQASQAGNEDVLNELMEAEANGHIYMNPEERLKLTETALNSITLEDMSLVAKQLCEHLSHMDASNGVQPAAVIACAPLLDRNALPFSITEKEVVEVIRGALQIPIEPLQDTDVPDTLISAEALMKKRADTPPGWAPLDEKVSGVKNDSPLVVVSPIGTVQRKLNNGIRVNLMSMSGESQRVSVRLYVPGGRMRESKTKPGGVLLGSRTIQEGGAFLDVTREEVELFCIDHLVMVDILAKEDALIFDFSSVTSLGAGGKVTGLEAVMQVLHIIMTDFKWEEDAFERAKQGIHEQYDSTVKGLETACVERITQSITQGDGRQEFPTHEDIDALDLNSVKTAVNSIMTTCNVEITMSGDVSMDTLENLALDYLGTIPMSTSTTHTATPLEPQQVFTMGRERQLGVYLPDSDERAMGYIAGPAPNKWGVFSDGTTVTDKMKQMAKKPEAYWNNPLFGHVALQVLQEVANRRLFSVVREEKRLTYDASFVLKGTDLLNGGWYLVSVTSSPSQVQEAVRACKEAMDSLQGPFGVMGDSVQSAKRTLRSRFRAETTTNKFWIENLCGTQLSEMPYKSVRCIAEYEKILGSIQVSDIGLLMEVLGLNNEKQQTTCIGVAAPTIPIEMSSSQTNNQSINAAAA